METFTYGIRESARAKYLRVTVHPNGEVVVIKPRRVSLAKTEAYIRSKRTWVEGVLKKFERQRIRKGAEIELPRLRRGTKAHKEAIKKAREVVHSRLLSLNTHYEFRYGRVAIKSQRTLWGSCSQKGNLNFNYQIAHLPSELADYLVAHELCHLKEQNHSPRFWNLVAHTIPDYKDRRKRLRAIAL